MIKGRDAIIAMMILSDYNIDEALKYIKDKKDIPETEELHKKIESFKREYDCITLVDSDYQRYGLISGDGSSKWTTPNILFRFHNGLIIDGTPFKEWIKHDRFSRVAIIDDFASYRLRKCPIDITMVGIEKEHRYWTDPSVAITQYSVLVKTPSGTNYEILKTGHYDEAVRIVAELCPSALISSRPYPESELPKGEKVEDWMLDAEQRTMFSITMADRRRPALFRVAPGKVGSFANTMLKSTMSTMEAIEFKFCDCWDDIVEMVQKVDEMSRFPDKGGDEDE